MAKKTTPEDVTQNEIIAGAAAEQARRLEESSPSEKTMVRYRLPVNMADLDEAIFVAVNGESYRIKRGEWVEIPDYIAEVLDRQQEADLAYERRLQHLVDNPMVTEVKA